MEKIALNYYGNGVYWRVKKASRMLRCAALMEVERSARSPDIRDGLFRVFFPSGGGTSTRDLFASTHTKFFCACAPAFAS